jgi:hypothetical protein
MDKVQNKPNSSVEAKMFLFRICGSHSGGYEEFYLLGYNGK